MLHIPYMQEDCGFVTSYTTPTLDDASNSATLTIKSFSLNYPAEKKYKLVFDPIASLPSGTGATKPAGNYFFTITYKYGETNTWTLKHKLTLPDRCDDSYLTISTTCNAEQQAVSDPVLIYPNIVQPIPIAPSGCTFTYTPDDCPLSSAPRDIIIDYNTHPSLSIFYQTASTSGSIPELLLTGSTYDPTKALTAQFQPITMKGVTGDASPWEFRLIYKHGT